MVTLAKELGCTQQKIDQVVQNDREKEIKMKQMANEVQNPTQAAIAPKIGNMIQYYRG